MQKKVCTGQLFSCNFLQRWRFNLYLHFSHYVLKEYGQFYPTIYLNFIPKLILIIIYKINVPPQKLTFSPQSRIPVHVQSLNQLAISGLLIRFSSIYGAAICRYSWLPQFMESKNISRCMHHCLVYLPTYVPTYVCTFQNVHLGTSKTSEPKVHLMAPHRNKMNHHRPDQIRSKCIHSNWKHYLVQLCMYMDEILKPPESYIRYILRLCITEKLGPFINH
jgi:hypothetical protein